MKHVIRWAPVVLIILLITTTQSTNANPGKFWGDKLQAESVTYQEEDDLSALEEYLELEEVHYVLRKDHPRTLTIYYVSEDDWRQATAHWVCEKVNVAFPKARLQRLSVVDLNDTKRRKTDLDC